MSNSLPLIGDDVRTITIKRILYKIVSRNGSLDGLRLIDLGSLEGGVAFEMAREDMDVTGIEGRESNFRKCQLIKEYFDLPNLHFLHLDVKKLNNKDIGTFDVVLCLGLLYHLDNPIEFIEILNEITHEKSLLFIDTHVAPVNKELFDCCVFKDRLSHIANIEYDGEKYEGRWYKESVQDDKLPDDPWASVSNSQSFWLTQASLMKALYFYEFKTIFDLYGCFRIEEELNLRSRYSRLWCIAMREACFEF